MTQMTSVNQLKSAQNLTAITPQRSRDKVASAAAGADSFKTALAGSVRNTSVASNTPVVVSAPPERPAARRAALVAAQQPAGAAVQEARAKIMANPICLANGQQDNATMKAALRAVTERGDPASRAHRDAAYCNMLIPYAGAPGRPMAASEIPDFDASGNYSIPGFGPAQTPLTQHQMDLFKASRASGFAPGNPGDYLDMLGIARPATMVPTSYLHSLDLDTSG